MEKTNAIRLLEQKKIPYQIFYYDDTVADSGVEVAAILNEDENSVFKTLVTVGKSKKNYVFVIPANRELDLKKAAKVAGEKSIEMIKSKELLGLTGYIHGGCSPIGMKKFFKTFIHETAFNFDKICISGGRRGIQVQLNPKDLERAIVITVTDLVA